MNVKRIYTFVLNFTILIRKKKLLELYILNEGKILRICGCNFN